MASLDQELAADYAAKYEEGAARRRHRVADLCEELFDPLGYPRPQAHIPPALAEVGAFCLRCDACRDVRQLGGVLGVGEDDFDWVMSHLPRITAESRTRRLGPVGEAIAAEEEAVADTFGVTAYLQVRSFFQALVSPEGSPPAGGVDSAGGSQANFREAAALLRQWGRGWFLREWMPRCAPLSEDFQEAERGGALLREPARSVLSSAGSYLLFLNVLAQADVMRARAMWLARIDPDPTPVLPYVRLMKLGLLPLPAAAGVPPRYLSLRGWLRWP